MLSGSPHATLAVALTISTSLAQAPIHGLVDPGDVPVESWPAAAPAGDFDGDGRADFWAAGVSARILSGVDRAVLLEIAPSPANPCAGCRLDGIGDIDVDGHGDALTSGEREWSPGRWQHYVRLLSGRDGSLFGEWKSPGFNDGFGTRSAPLGDLDGDGFGDVAVWAPNATPPKAYAFSGTTGTLLHQFSSLAFGPEVFGVGDVDADGHGDLVVFAAPSSPSSSAQVLSGRDLSIVFDRPNPGGVSWFGRFAAPLGDRDGDGHADFAIAGDDSRAFVLSGADGSSLLTLIAPQQGSWTPSFARLHPAGDIDGDGTGELIALVYAHGWFVDAYSGGTGAHLWRHESGIDLVGGFALVGDVNADGSDDLGVSGGWFQGGGTFHVLSLLAPFPTTYCASKTSSLGCEPLISWSGGVSVTVGDDLEMHAQDMLPRTTGALVWSTTPNALPFHGGLLCVGAGSPTVVTPPQRTGPSNISCTGVLQFRFTKAYLAEHGLGAGTTLHAQFVGRDPGYPFPWGISLTAAVQATLVP
jgi:hypothetical protein